MDLDLQAVNNPASAVDRLSCWTEHLVIRIFSTSGWDSHEEVQKVSLVTFITHWVKHAGDLRSSPAPQVSRMTSTRRWRTKYNVHVKYKRSYFTVNNRVHFSDQRKRW